MTVRLLAMLLDYVIINCPEANSIQAIPMVFVLTAPRGDVQFLPTDLYQWIIEPAGYTSCRFEEESSAWGNSAPQLVQ